MPSLTTLSPLQTPKPQPKILGWEARLERDLTEGSIYESEQSFDKVDAFVETTPAIAGSGTAILFNSVEVTSNTSLSFSSQAATIIEGTQNFAASTIQDTFKESVEITSNIKDLFTDFILPGKEKSPEEKKKEQESNKKRGEYIWKRQQQEATMANVQNVHVQIEAQATSTLAGEAGAMSIEQQNDILHLSSNLKQEFTAYRASELRKAMIEQQKQTEGVQMQNVVSTGPSALAQRTNANLQGEKKGSGGYSASDAVA